jgi:hypothetical protein
VDLETPEPVTPPEPDPTTPPEPPAEPEEADAVDVAGQKHVPLSALIEERKQKQTLKAKADQYDQVVGYVNSVKPYIEFLQANPNLMTRAQEAPPTPAATTQPVDPDAEELARTLDLYTADGKPDVVRGQKLLQKIDKAAETRSQAAIKPLQESTTRERSGFMYQRALVTKAPDGRAVDRTVLDAIWSRTDPTITSTEEGAAGIVAMALGLQLMQGGQAPPVVTPPSTPPLVTEAPGGRTTNRAPLSALDQSIAKLRGLDDKTYAERSRGFQSGRPNVLEDN